MSKKVTSSRVEKAAKRVKNSPSTSSTSKSNARSVERQAKDTNLQTSPRVAKQASKVLKDNRYGKDSKSVAGSALSQSGGKK